MNSREWSQVEQAELKVIVAQLDVIRASEKKLRAEIIALAETLPGFENLVSIKGIGSISAAAFLITIGDIGDFADTGKLAACFGIAPHVNQSNDSKHISRGSPSAATKLPAPFHALTNGCMS